MWRESSKLATEPSLAHRVKSSKCLMFEYYVYVLPRCTFLFVSGEMSDFQAIQSMLDGMHQSDINEDDGYTRSPSEVHNYMRAVMYQKRNKFNPLWNQLVVGGFSDGRPYLGFVDMIGTSFEEDFIATGFGGYLALPIIRNRCSSLSSLLSFATPWWEGIMYHTILPYPLRYTYLDGERTCPRRKQRSC